MPTIAIEGQSQLAELVGRLAPGEEVTLTRDDKPVATLKATAPSLLPPRVPGRGKGKLTIISDDDEHLNDFAEYM